nr:IPT/TIG domain-containing protein [Thermoflexibacter sp.]
METKKTNFIFTLLLSAFSFCYPLHKLYAQGMTPAPVPVITNITPAFGKVGDVVTINGDNFSTTPANNVVFFGGVKATVNTASLTALQVVVPAGILSLSDVRVRNILTGSSITSSTPFFNLRFDNGVINANTYLSTVINSGDYPISIKAGDINGDGRLDLITANQNSNNVSVLFRNNTNTGYD